MAVRTFRLTPVLALFFLGFNASAQLTRGSVEYNGKIIKFKNDRAGQRVPATTEGIIGTCSFNETYTQLDLRAKDLVQYTGTVEKSTGNAVILVNHDAAKTSRMVQLEEVNMLTLYPLDKTKVICGYTCKGVVAKDQNGNSHTFWYTDEIQAGSTAYPLSIEIPGVCLEFTLSMDDMDVTYTATRISDSVPNPELFTMTVPAGYSAH